MEKSTVTVSACKSLQALTVTVDFLGDLSLHLNHLIL